MKMENINNENHGKNSYKKPLIWKEKATILGNVSGLDSGKKIDEGK